MNAIRNIFAVIGILAIVVGVGGYMKMAPMIAAFDEFDEEAYRTYSEMVVNLLATGNPAEATVWKAKVPDDVSFEDVEESIDSIAVERNIRNVGKLPLSQQVELMTGTKQPIVKIYQFCNPLTAMRMIDHSLAYSAYLPCRIAVVEDKDKQLWLYTLNMDMMIHGGKPLPPAMREEALGVKDIMLDILNRGAAGEF